MLISTICQQHGLSRKPMRASGNAIAECPRKGFD
jgi:hypothetical protein